MDYFELESVIEEWAKNKGILEKGTPEGQAMKTLEETLEFVKAVKEKNLPEIMDGIGDIVVTLIIQCKMQQITLEACLEYAYNQIKDRQGSMIDGKFVKKS